MKTTIVRGLVATAGLLFAAAPSLAQDGASGKIAYIDSQRIIAEAPGAQEVRQTLETEMKGYRDELQKMEQDLTQMVQDYQQKESTLAADAKQQRQEAIRVKQRELQQRAGQLEERAAQRQQELVQPIMQRIEGVIDLIRKEQNYALIFDAAPGTGIIAADPALDITDQVLARLRQTANN